MSIRLCKVRLNYKAHVNLQVDDSSANTVNAILFLSVLRDPEDRMHAWAYIFHCRRFCLTSTSFHALQVSPCDAWKQSWNANV